MSDIRAAMQSILDQLDAGGVRAVIDAADVNPPCVQVRPPTLNYRFGGGCVGMDWSLRVLAADTGVAAATVTLGPILEAAQAALGYPSPQASPEEFRLLDGSTVPGYTLTFSTRT